ncbi:hypothetical protein DDB_G0267198 [Dictyostelium discoideum AX4]|uniref:Uncharacterized protein n=1 Tax=Dictyostelium discoideum TaxID=44689 RepID=Q55H66_DICDI|nr:hypothetical protein DDB_G0267198 [Dictyostelium discoideum AX4]EAL73836.1 hypothetical protein DDB_G0267198 [Dictyostelium discoideum AX4]|eukprot:XP_647760.1 hypothetical protein DDB_G0267198 [Dictyostelium discoideum AX4]
MIVLQNAQTMREQAARRKVEFTNSNASCCKTRSTPIAANMRARKQTHHRRECSGYSSAHQRAPPG